MKSLFITIIFLTFVFWGCEMFSTREPEPPSTGKSSFIPPTEPIIVIENFKSALLEKNTDYYVNCFSDTSLKANKQFRFLASGSALASFNSVFDNWTINSERRYFNSLISNINKDLSILLSLINSKMDILSPDSSIYSAEYQLQVPHNIDNLPKSFNGSLQFTISKQKDGLWAISYWIDNNPKNSDSLSNSWSILKARLSN